MEDSKPNDESVIFCEMCPEEDRKPARKTCMKCEISMCVQHLQAHLTTPVLLQTHPLTEPMTLGGANKCPQHGKLVEYYCLDDLTCVCVSCAIEDQHRLHNMKTFSTAHKELLEKLNTDQKELLFKIDDDNLSLEKWEKNEKEKVTRSSVRLIEAVSNLRDLTLTSVQTSVSARMVSLQTSKNSIHAAQKEKDTFKFLQMYSQVHQDVEKAKSVDLRKGLEPGTDRDKLVEEISAEMIKDQALDFWGSLLMMADPENHQEIIPTSEDLFFDPQTLSAGMSLSSDKREVFYCRKMGQFSATLLIQSTTSADINKWIISLPQGCDWIIGLCDRQHVTNLKSGPIYGLSYEGNQLSALSTEYHDDNTANVSNKEIKPTVPQKKQRTHRMSTHILSRPGKDGGALPETVEVVWNSPVLSFFSRSGQYQRQLIFTLDISPYDQDLISFVELSNKNDQFTPQDQECSCGSHSRKCSVLYGAQIQNKCSCGAFIGGLAITELICSLV